MDKDGDRDGDRDETDKEWDKKEAQDKKIEIQEHFHETILRKIIQIHTLMSSTRFHWIGVTSHLFLDSTATGVGTSSKIFYDEGEKLQKFHKIFKLKKNNTILTYLLSFHIKVEGCIKETTVIHYKGGMPIWGTWPFQFTEKIIISKQVIKDKC